MSQGGSQPTARPAVSKHNNNIFATLGLAQFEEDNRRALAVLAYFEG